MCNPRQISKDALYEVYANTYQYRCCVCGREGFTREEVHAVRDGAMTQFVCDNCDKLEMIWTDLVNGGKE